MVSSLGGIVTSAKVIPAWASDLRCDECGKTIVEGEFVLYDDESNTITHEEGCNGDG